MEDQKNSQGNNKEEKTYSAAYLKIKDGQIENLKKQLEEEKALNEAKIELPSDINDTLKALQEKIAALEKGNGGKELTPDVLSESIAAAFTKHQDLREGRPTLFSTKDIDSEDFNEKGVTFICHSSMHVVHTDIRKGRPVLVPYGKAILFGKTEYSRIKNGQREDVYYRCYATIHSNQVIDFLRKHTEFGFRFFELGKDKESSIDDRLRMDCLLAASKQVNGCDPARLIGLCETYKVNMGQHPDDIRTMLKTKIADAEFAIQLKRSKQLISDTVDAKNFR